MAKRKATPLVQPPRDESGLDWDPSRPIAEQWPWNGDAEHVTSDIVDEYGSLSQHLDALDDVELPRVERDIQELEADPAALLAAIPELTTAELDQPEPPPVVAEAIEKIAEVAGDEDGEP